MIDDYQGMRWFKCDLQVQTPEDNAHWADDDLRLGDPRRPKVEGIPSEQGIAEKARVFLNRCHELELDIIGITDHNFSQKTDPRDWFLTHLVEQNKDVAKAVGRAPLVIFPGFEVDIGYHVLCLFPAARKQSDIENCNRFLTKLGLSEVERFERSQPKLLRKGDESVSLKTLINHVQGEMGGIVIAAHSDQASGMLEQTKYRDDFSHPELYCVEVTQNPPTQKYLTILQGKDPNWKRSSFSPAYIMSSDAKSLKTDKDGKPKPNSLGYRYTWIKMSRPSIESLRQAFLDPISRIMIPEDIVSDKNPTGLVNYPYIKAVKILGADFLADQTVYLSPNKTCLIGGRGTGKSTVLEYLRLALGKDNGESGSKAERVKKTIKSPTFSAVVEYRQKHGVDYQLQLTSDGISIIGNTVVDKDALLKGLRAHFYSQQELNKITEADEDGQLKSTAVLLSLVDGFVAERLEKLYEREENLLGKIRHKLNLKVLNDENLATISSLTQQIFDSRQQWQARQDVQIDARLHSSLKKEQAYIDALVKLVNVDIEQLKTKVQEVDASFGEFNHDDSPNTEWFKELDLKIRSSNEELKSGVIALVDQHKKNIKSIFEASQQWQLIKSQLDNADSMFEQACAAKGINPEDIRELTSLAERIAQKESELATLVAQTKEHEEALSELVGLQTELEQVWSQQFSLRREAAEKANQLAVYEDSKKSFVSVSVVYQGDRKAFWSAWRNFGPQDKRGRLAREWDSLIEVVYLEAINDLQKSVVNGEGTGPEVVGQALSLWRIVEEKVSDTPALAEVNAHISNNRREWDKLITKRLPDSIDITLYRDDGSEAGKVSDNSLSDGQRNTAVLALLLAQDGGPLIIDQPEDELDSNFVFKELLPMIRRMKSRRQLIFATHNANLPVNGDAELVYAFEARGGKGICKAQGGLDRREVTDAVLDIMEGSEKAFVRRREKYGF